jgi:RimJ/RimL family protein N-acetyltransferase
MDGRVTRVEPLDPARHENDLFAAYAEDQDGKTWTYMVWGPFANQPALRAWLDERAVVDDPLMFAIVDKTSGLASGVATFMRIDPNAGVIEVGGIAFAPRLQRSLVATEAMYLMMRRAFDELGYRRYEWKCDALNQPSRIAAKRFGFRYEGTFSQATIYKGRNRDTAWFSITDSEWPAVKAAMETWLAPDNFDASGRQRQSLSRLTASLAAPR